MIRQFRLIIVFVVLSFHLIFSQTYTVEVEVMDMWYDSPENFYVEFQANIYRDGTLIPHSTDYYYQWYVYLSHKGYWEADGSGRDVWQVSNDQFIGGTVKVYVVVTDSVHFNFVNLASDTVGPLGMDGNAISVDFEPYKEQGQSLNGIVEPEHWRYTINRWKVGYNSFLTDGETERLRATPNLIQSDNLKFAYWDDDPTKILHYNEFSITPSVNRIKPIYKEVIGGAVLTTHLMPGVDTPYDSIEFKDPWVVDTTDSRFYTAPYGYHSLGMEAPFLREAVPFILSQNSKYQGVFINQGYSQGQWQPPYYSVRAPSPQIIPFHGVDIAWYFQGWEGDSVAFQDASAAETPVVFLGDSAVVRAVYKGHLVTDKLSRLGFSSQRHVARNGTTWYLTYWEDGKIYVTTSSDGVNWNSEVCISGNLDNCSRPSIAAGLVNGYAYVVWQRKIDTNQYEVYVSRTSNSGQSWSSPYKLSTVQITTAQRYGPQPVVAEMRVQNLSSSSGSSTVMAPPPSYTYHTLVAYVCTSGLKWHKSTNQGASWGSQQNISVANTSYVWFPSMVSGTDYVALVYSYRYGGYEVTSRLYKGYGWTSAADVSGPLNLVYDRIPSVSIDRNGNLFCAWLGQVPGNSNYKIAIRKGDATNTWSTQAMTSFYPPDGSSAHGVNINFIDNTNLDVVFHSTGKRVYRREYVSSLEDYISHEQLSSNGYYGNLPAFRQSDFADAFGLWVENSGAPYLIKNTKNLSHSSAASTVAGTVGVRRRAVVYQAGADHVGARLQLGDVTVGGDAVFLEPLKGNTPAVSRATVGEYLRSQVFQVKSGERLEAEVLWSVPVEQSDSVGAELSSGDYQGLSPAVELVEVGSGKVAWRGAVSSGEHRVVLLGGRDIAAGSYQLQVELEGSSGESYAWYVQTESSYGKQLVVSSEALAGGEESVDETVLPATFRLQPAYPNPFNPSTTVRYGLPEASEVEVILYNIRGQQVRRLVQARQSAGWHSVVWDGRNDSGERVSSGVYVVRLTARPLGSKAAPFVQSRKVVLVK